MRELHVVFARLEGDASRERRRVHVVPVDPYVGPWGRDDVQRCSEPGGKVALAGGCRGLPSAPLDRCATGDEGKKERAKLEKGSAERRRHRPRGSVVYAAERGDDRGEARVLQRSDEDRARQSAHVRALKVVELIGERGRGAEAVGGQL